MSNNGDILVVGTTADYIEWIERRCKSETVFLTAQGEREKSQGMYSAPRYEILADLNHPEQCLQQVRNYVQSTGRCVSAVACFDDESLLLAAVLAKKLGVSFPSVESIRQCLDKHLAKQAWRKNGVPCPGAIAVTEDMSEKAKLDIAFPCVLKPHSSSGSERVFFCENAKQMRQMAERVISPHGKKQCDTAVAEEFISGEEFSCDFSISDGNVQILRTARKIMASESPLGTTLAYILPGRLSSSICKILPDILRRAAESLGFSRAVCMVDFIVRDEEIFLIEMSPRIGGDCLPHVLWETWGVDSIDSALAFSKRATVNPWLKESAPCVAGLRVFSPGPGVVTGLDIRHITDDPRTITQNLDNCIGRTVIMPPAEYSSWLLGHVIFQPYASRDIEEQIHELHEGIHVYLETAK